MNIRKRKDIEARINSAICAVLISLCIFIGMKSATEADAHDGYSNSNIGTTVATTVPETRPATTKPEVIVTTPPTVPTTMPTTPVVPTSPPVNNAPLVKYYDVPLGENLQNCIFELCSSYGVDPTIIVAMIYRESTFNATAVGDRGNSLGLMQIQPRWFQKRMSELGITQCCEGCSHETCLLNPYQNVSLGIDYVAELMASGKSIQWVLMAYNGGPSYADQKAAEGVVTDYAKSVINYSYELKGWA